MKSLSFRLLPLLPLIAALSAGLRADEVQKLPDMQVARPVTKDVQVTLAVETVREEIGLEPGEETT